MASQPNKSASKNDFLKSPKDTNNSKLTNKEIREQYFTQLRLWLDTVNSYQCFYNKLQQESFQKNYQQFLKKSNEVPNVVPNVGTQTPTVEPIQFVGTRCQIPSLWKRFGAEVIDFIILSLIKFLTVYFLVDSFFDIDFTKYYSIFTRDDYNVDYTAAAEMTFELFVIELTHRMTVCIYEIYFLQGRTLYVQSGATIGKLLLGLSVVRANKLFIIRGQPSNVIALTPGGDIGWRRATFRSITKNLFFAFLFPLPFITATVNQNRCAYDIVCETMVVELTRPLRCEQSELIRIG